MFAAIRRFLADDDGHLVAADWAILATVLLLGSVLALLTVQRQAGAPLPPLPSRSALFAPASPAPVVVDRP